MRIPYRWANYCMQIFDLLSDKFARSPPRPQDAQAQPPNRTGDQLSEMVVLTLPLLAASSNQRLVTVLVWV